MNSKTSTEAKIADAGVLKTSKCQSGETAYEKIRRIKSYKNEPKRRKKPHFVSASEIASKAKLRILEKTLHQAVTADSLILRLMISPKSLMQFHKNVVKRSAKASELIIKRDFAEDPSDEEVEEFEKEAGSKNKNDLMWMRYFKYTTKIVKGCREKLACKVQVRKLMGIQSFQLFSFSVTLGEFLSLVKTFKSVEPCQIKSLDDVISDNLEIADTWTSLKGKQTMLFDIELLSFVEATK